MRVAELAILLTMVVAGALWIGGTISHESTSFVNEVTEQITDVLNRNR
jgi:hypothetical protein